jgi:4a-hydroxytetrahydrobiopterin dehydratase
VTGARALAPALAPGRRLMVDPSALRPPPPAPAAVPTTARDNLVARMTLLSDAEIEQRLATVGEWRRRERDSIVRELDFADFAGAIAFVNRVAELAERANHHPDMLVHGYNRVRLTCSTHSAGGLTDADFELAAAIDRLA